MLRHTCIYSKHIKKTVQLLIVISVSDKLLLNHDLFSKCLNDIQTVIKLLDVVVMLKYVMYTARFSQY